MFGVDIGLKYQINKKDDDDLIRESKKQHQLNLNKFNSIFE